MADEKQADEKRTIERLRAELGEWRTRVDRLRVQANLGRKEARDQLRELETRMSPAFEKASQYLEGLVASGSSEVRALGKSLLAGWEELRRTHRELSKQAKAEGSKPGQGKGA